MSAMQNRQLLPVYLDYAATTPIDLQVVEKMLPWLTQFDHFGNPASTHIYGRTASAAVEAARQQVAGLINAEASEIIWTSGATEADNLAVKGVAQAYRDKGQHIITCQTEHEAVIESCRQLEREGFTVTYLAPEKNGLVDLIKLEQALRADTILVSIMHVNNEIGVVQDIAAIGALLRSRGIIFHVDAVQAAGKLPIDVKQLPVDLMAFSGHKIYGPKGIGALYVRSGIRVNAQQHGGGHEQGVRSGTLATHQIVGMGEAFAMAKQLMADEAPRVRQLRDRLWAGIQALDNVYRNGDSEASVSGILNVVIDGVDNTVLLPALRDLAMSTGSACHAATCTPSHVLRALGLSGQLAQRSIRFSLGRFTTEQEIDFAIEKISKAVKVLRE